MTPRTPEVIKNEILTDIATWSELAGLNNASLQSIYKQIAGSVAYCIYVFELLFKRQTEDINKVIDTSYVGTRPFIARKCYAYQHGMLLEETFFNSGIYVYPTIDTELQIIKRVGINSDSGQVNILVAKEVGGEIVVLTEPERLGLVDYLKKFKIDGIAYLVKSIDADKLTLTMIVYYSASADLLLVKAQVEAAIENYIANIDFNGIFYTNKLIDAIQAVKGVSGAQAKVQSIVSVAGAIVTNVDQEHRAVAGYFAIDSGNPLDTTITYQAV